ncbi:MAG: alpha/beta fold hydrolase [Tissierellia bacterium]|nr:alpha/beta fold hydrolase [Tissierellia bacterium]
MNPIGVVETKHMIEDIPAVLLKPEGEGPFPTLIFYHGWTSDKENQRFRGRIFASYGWQVLIPDAPYHGERGQLDYEGEGVAEEYFFKVIFQEIKEFPKLLKFLEEETKMKKNTLCLSGHSMGAILSGGVLAKYPDKITNVVAYNGAWDWEKLRQDWDATLPEEEQQELERLNPLANLDSLVKKRFLLANGEDDSSVNPMLQKDFYEKMKEKVGVKEYQTFLTFEDTAHVTTTQMMEEGVLFLEKWK